MKIFGDKRSGNCQKIKFVADYLRQPYQWIDVDILQGESRTPAFLQMSPYGQVPVVEFSPGQYLSQSNAIIAYQARDTALLPTDPWTAAQIQQWLFWEQYSHEPNVAVTRFQLVYEHRALDAVDQDRLTRGNKALDLMDAHLQNRTWIVGDTITIADIALLAYTRLAPEGGYDLKPRSSLTSWIETAETELGIPT